MTESIPMRLLPVRLLPVRLLPVRLLRLRRGLSVLAEYLGVRGAGRERTIADDAALARFLDTRASHVAQTTLYGYLRTRAGARYPDLFENDAFVVSINHAKWQMWLACLSDLAVYAGGLLAHRSRGGAAAAGVAVGRSVDAVLVRTGRPADSGPRFDEGVEAVRGRLLRCDWPALGDDETAFTASPEALVRHAPIIPELMALDEEIVRNSVRFRWQEVRRELRAALDTDAVIEGAGAACPQPPGAGRDVPDGRHGAG